MASKKQSRKKKQPKQQEQPYRFWRAEPRLYNQLAMEFHPWKGWLLAVTLLAFALRFFGLGNASLWMDEIVILQEAPARQFETVSYSAHMTHLEPVRLMLKWFGETAFGVRVWSALLGTLAVPLIFLWGLWTRGSRLAVGASLLATVNCFLIMYSQDGNYYGGMTFYMAGQLAAYTLFFRGAPYTGGLLLLLAGIAGFKNHPISAIPTAVMLAGMGVGAFIFRDIREKLIAWKPSEWKGRPAVPVLAAALVVLIPFSLKNATGFLTTTSGLITPGETTLTNVAFKLPFFWDHLTALGVNFHRMGETSRLLAIVPLAYLLAGFLAGIRDAGGRKSPAQLAFLGLALVLPIVSYIFLFSLQMDRNFNLRYFIYLAPVFLGVAALPAAVLADWLGKKRENTLGASFWSTLAPYGAVALAFSLVYLAADKSNYRSGTEALNQERKAGEPIIASTRNDRIQAYYYLDKAGLPATSPDFTFLSQPGYEDAYGAVFPYLMNGEQSAWIISAWRHVQAKRLYGLYEEGLPLEYDGNSKWNSQQDFRLHHWDYGSNVVYPYAAARISPSAGEPLLVAGADATSPGRPWRGC